MRSAASRLLLLSFTFLHYNLSFIILMMDENILYDVLCAACQNISSRGERTWQPHSTLTALRLSAASACHLCSLMLSCLEESYPGQLQYKDPEKLNFRTFLYFQDAKMSLSVDSPEGPTGHTYNYMKGSMFLAPVDVRELEDLKRDRSETSFSMQINRWKENCMLNHPICSSEWKLALKKRRLPTRLLDLGLKGEEKHLHLATTQGLPLLTDYVTLSHCWGTTPLLSLRTESYASFLESIPIALLPRTFRDAVQLVRDLGLRYLWVDSLCIIQDSREDWLKESSLMCDIYSQALLNLAASSSANGNGGLLLQQNSLSAHPCLVHLRGGDWDWDTPKAYICYPEKLWSKNVEESPLGKRAWVLQERLLSSRIVHFGRGQIFWECHESIAANNLPPKCHPEPGIKTLKVLFQDPAANGGTAKKQAWEWNEVVAKYSACNLTFDSDKLVAISGLAARFAQHLEAGGDTYLAGLWRSTLPGSLLWHADSNNLQRERVDGLAPSWSWACVDGLIQPGSGYRAANDILSCRVLDVSITQQNSEAGIRVGGFIRLQGPLAKVSGTSEGPMLPGFSTGMTIIWDEHTRHDDYFTRAEGNLFFPISAAKLFRCIICSGLILRPTGMKQGQFQRIGYICGGFDPTVFLTQAMDPGSIEESLYVAADREKGFILDIV